MTNVRGRVDAFGHRITIACCDAGIWQHRQHGWTDEGTDFGQTYSIQGDWMRLMCRSSQNSWMKDAHDRGCDARVDTQKVAVLTALAIADELHSSQREIGDREEC